MRRRNKLIFALLGALIITTMAACGKEGIVLDPGPERPSINIKPETSEEVEQSKDDVKYTVVDALTAQFNITAKEEGTTAEKLAIELTTNETFDGIPMVAMVVEPGYLNGFDEEITDFKNGAVFSPMISTIPFVGYVFEVEDPEGFEKQLCESANMSWNICTQADMMSTTIVGNYVLFVMSPKTFE